MTYDVMQRFSDDQIDDAPPLEQAMQFERLRQQYLEARREIADERWHHGSDTRKMRRLEARRNQIRAEADALAKHLGRSDWPPTPWEK